MNPLVGGEVQRKVSAVASLVVLGTQPQDTEGQDLADLGQAFSGRHETGIEGVAQSAVSVGAVESLPKPRSPSITAKGGG
jgi:hypothetical protein